MSRMTSLSKTFLTAAALLAAPALASAQEPEPGAEPAGQAGATAAAEATADAAARAQGLATAESRIEAAMEAATQAQVPVSLLESKVEEGKAKGVPMERVAAAVEARLQGLIRARDALQQAGARTATEGELLVTAEALQAGVAQDAIASVVTKAPAERRAVATAVLTDLVRLGYDSNAAWARVDASLSSGPESLVNLRAEAAASLRARGLLSTGVGAGLDGGLDL